MVKVSWPTFPNWRRTVSSSPFPPGWLWSIVATSWKFFTDATVTRPWKFKHQHCKCSCHLWGFVPQNCTSRRSRLQSIHLWIVKIFFIDCFLQHWALEWANHPPWTSWLQEVKFIRDLPNLKIACWNLRAYLLACKSPASSATWGLCTTVWWLAVIDCKVGT